MRPSKFIEAAFVIMFSVFIVSNSFAKPVGGIPARDEFIVEVVSSAPTQVTGGDARIHIQVPRTVPLHQVEVLVNGTDQRSHFSQIGGTRTLTGVIDGLVLGAIPLQYNLTEKARAGRIL